MGAGGASKFWIAVVASSLALAAPAYAESAATLSPASVTPANGASLAAASVSFEITGAPAHLTGLSIEVSTANVPGQDGTLANDFVKGTVFLSESDAYPGTYRGTAPFFGYGISWTDIPATYYWQVSGTEFRGAPTFEIVKYISPVYTLTIGAPTPSAPTPSVPPAPVDKGEKTEPPAGEPPTLSLSEAWGASLWVIRHRTGHYARGAKHHCVRLSESAARCKATWGAPLPPTSKTWIYTGTFEIEAVDSQHFEYTFEGAKAQYVCVRHHSVRHCLHAVHW